MNKIYKVIWSKVRNCYVAVSEIAKRNGKSCTSVNCGAKANRGLAGVVLSAAVGATLLAGVCSVLLPVRIALAAPVMPTLDYKGGTVKAASPYVTINSTALGSTATMNISSTQPNNVLKWIDFSIGKGGTVQFDTRNYLNYVIGHGRSEIDGTLKGAGNIYLINPNGILFGSNASVDVGNLYLSTRKLTPSELTNFTNSGTNPLDNPSSYVLGSEIINLGKLKATNIIVEGKNITFKNVADVTPTNTINVRARTDGGEVHVGYAASSVVNAVNTTEYTNGHITQPNLSKWIFKNEASETIEPTKYMLVRNAYELQNMQNNKSSETIGTWTYVDYVGNFMLANDIDFNGTTFSPGFKPIGYNDETNKIEYRFVGKFDGLNYKIKNLKITDGTDGTAVTLPADASDSIGLFGVNRGTIENLGVENTTINVSKNSVGGVVGTNNGVVRNVYHTGSVKGAGNVGGIVGKSDSYGSEGIKASYNTGNVTGTNNVGGIAGYQSTTAKIEVVFNEGSVNGETKVGGITGYAKNVFNSYNTGEVKGTDYVGGITGEFDNNYLQKSYNVGKVTGTTHAGGIAGSDGTAQYGSRITNCVFSKGPDNGIGTYVEDEANMKKRTTFSGFSMTTSGNTTGSIWRIYEGQTIPFLAAFLKNKDVVTATEYNGAEQSFVMPSDSHILGSVSISRTSAGRVTKNNVLYSSDQLGYDLFDTVLLIQPKQLTIGNVSKEYDGTTAATLAVDNLAGVVNGDATDLTVTTTSATYNTKNVGTGRTVTYNDIKLGGDKKNNYIIVDSATGTGSITAKPLTVGNVTKVYDGEATAPTLTVANLQGVVDGDAITFDSSKVSGSYANENVGNGKTVTYTVNSGALTGTDAGNYSIATAGTGDITPRTVTLDGTISKVYDATDEATPTVDALSNVIEADKEELRISATSATFSDVNVGDELTVTYAGLQLGGPKAGNYSLEATDATVLNNSITQRDVTLTGTISKVYDGTKAAIPSAHTLENVIGEDLEYLDLLATSALFNDKNVGENNRTITYEGLTLSGEKAPNYRLTNTSATIIGNTIIPKELALVADKVRIKKGGTPPTTFTGRMTGFVPGEELNPADTSKLSFSASVLDTTTAGSYAITGTFNGDDHGNYGENYTFKNAISNATAFTIFTDMMPKLDLRGGDIKAASPYVTIDDTTANTMVISSTQDNNVLKWIDFSIDSGGTVKYDAKNYLNFVTGHGRSEIYGTLAGEGNIYLINPNGILFGSDAQVDVGSLYVSTRDISDKLSDFDTAVGALFPATYDNAAVGDIINMGRLDADLIKAEGRNISFKNIADVTKGGTLTDGVITGGTAHNEAANGSVTLTVNNVEADPDHNVKENKGEIHLGFAVSDTLADRVNTTQYTNVTTPTLTGWTTNVTPIMYMLVHNEYELQNMNNNLTKENGSYMPGHYMLANDIDASLFKFMPVGSVNNSSPISTGVFKGKFDGLYHVIKDITIDKTSVRSGTTTDIGLIGSNAGTVENLGVVNGTVDATGISSNSAIGGIVGANKAGAVIRNVYFSGSVKGYSSIGGIAGWQNDAYYDYPEGKIENAYSTGTVSGSSAGAIVGHVGGIIRNAYGKETNSTTRYFVYDSNGTYTNYVTANSMKNLQYFADKGFDISSDGTGSATWRIYEGQTMPLLTSFLRTKALVTEKEYNGNNEHSFDKTLAEGDNHIIAVDTSDFTAKGTNAGVYQEETKKFYSDQQGYNIVDTELVIQPKRLTIGNISKVYDGSTTATVTKDKLIGVLEGDATGLTISNTTANFDNKNAGEGKSIEYSGLSLTGDKSGNYMIAASGTSTTGKITQAPITLSVNDNFSKVYNGSDDASDAVNKIVSGTLYTGDSIKSIKKTFDNKNVGTGKTITVSDAVIGDSADNDGNYAISYTTNSTGKITQVPIKLSVSDNFSKVYNGSDDASGATDKIVSGTLYTGDSIKSIKKTFDDKNVGTGKTITVSDAVIGDSADNDGNYAISYTANATGKITQAPITLSVNDNFSKVYNGSDDASDAVDKIVSGTLYSGDSIKSITKKFDNKNVGEGKTITVSDAVIGDIANNDGNYAISYTANATGKITQAPITLSVNDNFSKVYNGSDDASGAVDKIVSGTLYSGDSIKSITKKFDNKNVGEGKTITVSNAVIGDIANNDGNYAISYTANATGKITQAPITLSVNDNFSKVYDGSEDASGATDKIVSGTLYTGDSIKSIKKTFDDKNVGTGKTITVSTAVIGDSADNNGNYAISYTTNTTGAITQAPITLSVADDYSRAYNGGVDASGATTTITSGEVFTGDSILSIKKEYSDKNVGTGKTITVSNAIIGDGAGNNSNYNINYVTNTGAITQAPITLSVADGYIRTYDGTLDASGATTSVTSGEVFAGDSIISIKKEFTDQMVGYGKCIKVSGAVIGDGNGNNSNYAVSYADGSGQVTAADLKLTAENVTKTYDGTTDVATADGKLKIVSGQLFGDDKMSGGVFAFADKNVGTNKTVTVSGATISDGFSGSNYNVTYVDNTASTITQKTITATFADISKTYDGTTSATAGVGTLSGVETIDAGKVSVSASAAYDKRNSGSRIVNYSGVTLSGDEAANYSIATTATGAGTITPKELTATFADISKTYDGTTSATAGAGTLAGVIAADEGKVSVSASAAYDQKNAGSRIVNYSGVALSGDEAANYSIATAATGAGTITPKALTATFADITKVYDGTTSATAGAGTLSGVETVDTGKVSVSASAAYDEKNAGSRTVNYTGVTLGGTEAANYSIATTATGAGTITPKELTATFADISKIYDGTTNTAPGAGTLTGVIAADEGKVNVSATDASYDEKNAGNRTVNYTGVTLSGAEAGNYSIATTATGNGTIGRKALELVADPASTEYGDYNPASFTGRVDGFVAGESVSNGDSLQFALSDPSASAVGSYGITGTINGSASGDYGLNYSFTNAASNANAFVIYARPASVQDMVLSDIIPGIKGMTGANISVTALDNSLEQATDKKAEVGIEFAVAQTILSVDADRNLSLENQGMKQPPAMTPQEVAEQVHAQQGNGNGVAAQAGGNAGAASAGANENGAASNAGVAGAVNAAMDVVQQTDDAVGTEESKRKKGVA